METKVWRARTHDHIVHECANPLNSFKKLSKVINDLQDFKIDYDGIRDESKLEDNDAEVFKKQVNTIALFRSPIFTRARAKAKAMSSDEDTTLNPHQAIGSGGTEIEWEKTSEELAQESRTWLNN
ncbi:hypothetical protein ACFE04_023059 [Oxalis oulophora]